MRTQKFYRKNEQKVMRELGFEPTPNSGSGWIIKEDGQTDYTIAQLKSTDAESIRISLFDMDKLEANAAVSHKRPIFVIQFLKTQDVFLVIRPDDDIMKMLNRELKESEIEFVGKHDFDENIKIEKDEENNRQKFYDEREKTRNERETQIKNDRKVRGTFGKEKSKRRLDVEFPV